MHVIRYASYRKDTEGSLLAKHNGLIVRDTMTPNSKATWVECQAGTLTQAFCVFLQSLREVSGNVQGIPTMVTALKDVEIN